jgi:glycogen debranching enzyme
MARNSLEVLQENNVLYASAKNEVYGCVFGRDTAITILFLLDYFKNTKDYAVLEMAKTSLLHLGVLQGIKKNINSGEEPGKIIHEYRKNNYERLINRPKPWYVYPDGILRNFDSVDSTPLTLIAIYRLKEIIGENDIIMYLLEQNISRALEWIIKNAAKNKHGFVTYTLDPNRKYGGLVVQSWTDSHSTLADADGIFPEYPIAQCEVQMISWYALALWNNYFKEKNPALSKRMFKTMKKLQENFNKMFIRKDDRKVHIAQAFTGDDVLQDRVTGNMGFVFYFGDEENGYITDRTTLSAIADRLFEEDIFSPNAGISTMSKKSPNYDITHSSYHNGSYWPMMNAMVYLGLHKCGFINRASMLFDAMLKPILFFNCPIELFNYDDVENYKVYISPTGKMGCNYQTWTVAGLLASISTENKNNEAFLENITSSLHA